MRFSLPSLCALAIATGLTACQSPPSATTDNTWQPEQPLNGNWQFFRSTDSLTPDQAAGNNSWKKIELPHTPKIEPLVVNDQFQGDAWYKRTLSYQPQWDGKRVKIDFEGAMNIADIWLNGEMIAHHKGGYLPFTVDLTEHLDRGDNELLIRLDNRDNKITGPKPITTRDFNMYGGLYRNAWLRVENPVHITDPVAADKTASGGVFVTYPEVSDQRARVGAQTHVVNTSDARQTLHVRHSLWRDGKKVAQTEGPIAVPAHSDAESNLQLTVSQPALWSPDSPNLYQLKTTVLAGNRLLDKEQTRIGIRKFRVEPGALYINGEKTFLRGVNRHQEYPHLGYALSDEAQYRDAAKIKAAGFDYVRLSHYPHSKAFMRAADELGLVVLDAILGWQYYADTRAFRDHVVQTCRDTIRRDRNHPSVLAWECSLNESPMPKAFVDRLNDAVHNEYPGEQTYSAGWMDYGYDIYLQARQHRLDHYEQPDKPYIVSEYGDWEYYAMNAGLNQDSWGDLLQEERSSRQLLSDGEKRLQQQAANVIEAHNDNFNTPAIADGYWVMFDYNRGYADNLEASGLMSIHRRPKFSYHFFQSQRDADQYAGPNAGGYKVFIASYWQSDSSPSFEVYSNADEIALRLNGQLIERTAPNTEYKNLTHPPFRFELDQFTPGTLEAVAYADGKEVARHSVTTPGEPASLALSADLSGKGAARNDLVFVHARVLDTNGHYTRINGKPVTFEVSGPAELVGPKTTNTKAGAASALIKITGDPAEVHLSADSESVRSARRDDLF